MAHRGRPLISNSLNAHFHAIFGIPPGNVSAREHVGKGRGGGILISLSRGASKGECRVSSATGICNWISFAVALASAPSPPAMMNTRFRSIFNGSAEATLVVIITRQLERAASRFEGTRSFRVYAWWNSLSLSLGRRSKVRPSPTYPCATREISFRRDLECPHLALDERLISVTGFELN